MSFILDALKKSEAERQRQAEPAFAETPTAAPERRSPAWLWLLAGLLLINLAVLLGLWLRQPMTPAQALRAEPEVEAPLPAGERAAASTADEFAQAVAERAARKPPAAASSAAVEPVALTATPPDASRTSGSVTIAERPVEGASTDARSELGDMNQLMASGAIPASDLRLDIHVFSEQPAERFVFINMTKHREGSVTADGLRVDEITPDGVILDYRGNVFLLPRQ